MKTFLRIGLFVAATAVFGAQFLMTSSADTLRPGLVEMEMAETVADDLTVPPVEAQARSLYFSHNTRQHKTGKYASCSSCHDLPEKNWKSARRDKLDPFPDVTTFPYHDSCFACHNSDVFSKKGVFCGSCHTEASQLAKGGAGVLKFPLPARGRQFRTIFPHDIHQDLIASNEPPIRDYAVAHFIPASFSTQDPPKVDNKKTPFYSCAVCHKTPDDMPKWSIVKLNMKPVAALVPDKADPKTKALVFSNPAYMDGDRTLDAAYFKTSPESHMSCFNCHYQFQNLPEGKQSCAGCHELTNPFKPYLNRNTIKRYSLKFDHDRGGHDKADCTACHVQITQSGELKKRDADGKRLVEDVPIASCKDCHETQDSSAEWKQILTAEIDKRTEDAKFSCAYCHTSAIGSFEIPASHRKPTR